MQSALILIFHNNENQIKHNIFKPILESNSEYMFCLIDNKSSDNSLIQLKELNHIYPNNVRVVEIKKKFNLEAAARAGYRYLISLQNWKNIGYAHYRLLFHNGYILTDLLEIMETCSKNHKRGAKIGEVRNQITQTSLNDLMSLHTIMVEQPNAMVHTERNKIIHCNKKNL